MFTLTMPIQHGAGSFTERDKARKGSKKQTGQKGRNKAALKCQYHDGLRGKIPRHLQNTSENS